LAEGSLYNILNGKKILCESPCVFYATTKDKHSVKKASEKNFLLINLIVRDSTIINMINSFSGNTLDAFYSSNHIYPIAQQTIDKINSILSKANLLQQEQIHMHDNLICSAVLLIVQNIYQQKISETNYDDASINDFYQNLNRIMANPDFPTYTVSDLCSLLSYSRMQLNRIFKSQFNTTPHNYLIKMKFTYAKSLLSSTDMGIKEIAFSIGYSSVSQFHTAFKKMFGITPKEFRKLYQKNN
jgi:AraC-like DNA-binding protein